MPIILVVEDDQMMLKAIGNILNKDGFKVHHALNGKEAMQMLDTASYDIVITDLMMPLAGGLEVVNKIRSDESKKHVGVIVVSSVFQEESVTEAFNLGADDFLKKPVMGSELVLRIRKLLSRNNFSEDDVLTDVAGATASVDINDSESDNISPQAESLVREKKFMITIHKFTEDHQFDIALNKQDEVQPAPTRVLPEPVVKARHQPEERKIQVASLPERKTFAKTYPEVVRVGNAVEIVNVPVSRRNNKTYVAIAVAVFILGVIAWALLPKA